MQTLERDPQAPRDADLLAREGWLRRLLLAYPRFVRRQGIIRGLLLGVMILTVFAAIFAKWIAPFEPTGLGFNVLAPPSSENWLGTDQLGRDVLSRIIHGARPSLLVAFVAAVAGIVVGVPAGLVAGYSGRFVGGAIMRLVDIMLAFPGLLMALMVVTLLGPGLRSIMIAISIAMVPWFARMVYGATVSIKQRGYVDSARVLGASPIRIVALHIAPNLGSQVAVLATASLGWGILIAATLNFLGFGLSPPTADWGIDLEVGRQWLHQAWWLAVAPGVAISLTILATNLLGDIVAGVTARADQVHPRNLRRQVVGSGTL